MSSPLPDEGYVKFRQVWRQVPLPPGSVPASLIHARNELHRLGLIGVYPVSGIGFGNASIRLESGGMFAISGSATGAIRKGNDEIYAIVDEVDILENTVQCHGPVTASSESMTHAACYSSDPRIGCVLHIHHQGLWERLLWKVPTTAEDVPYGTPGMAMEIQRILWSEVNGSSGLVAMAGHPEGLVAFGTCPADAMKIILAEWQ